MVHKNTSEPELRNGIKVILVTNFFVVSLFKSMEDADIKNIAKGTTDPRIEFILPK